jgi:hypothetical protein
LREEEERIAREEAARREAEAKAFEEECEYLNMPGCPPKYMGGYPGEEEEEEWGEEEEEEEEYVSWDHVESASNESQSQVATLVQPLHGTGEGGEESNATADGGSSTVPLCKTAIGAPAKEPCSQLVRKKKKKKKKKKTPPVHCGRSGCVEECKEKTPNGACVIVGQREQEEYEKRIHNPPLNEPERKCPDGTYAWWGPKGEVYCVPEGSQPE